MDGCVCKFLLQTVEIFQCILAYCDVMAYASFVVAEFNLIIILPMIVGGE